MKTLKYYILKIVLLFGILNTAIYAKAQSDTTIFYPTEIKGIPISLIKKKMAYEGTWKYESRDTTFIIRLKAVYRKFEYEKEIAFYLSFYGTYSLKIKNYKVENNNALLLNLVNCSFDRERITNKYPIMLAEVWLEENIRCFRFMDYTRNKDNGNFFVRVDTLDAYNNQLYWDFYDRPKSHGWYWVNTTFSRGEGYSIPEKCTLTRISHDPYYEIDMDL